jgi:hypothetical protein
MESFTPRKRLVALLLGAVVAVTAIVPTAHVECTGAHYDATLQYARKVKAAADNSGVLIRLPLTFLIRLLNGGAR